MAVTEPRHTRAGATHEVLNQPPPLEPYNVFEQDRPLVEALQREGAGWAEERLSAVGEIAGGEARRVGPAGEREPARAAHARPLRQPDRRGRVPPGLARADGRRRSRTALHSLPWTEPRPGAHVGARRGVHRHGPGRGRPRLPDLDDLRRRPGAARARRSWRPSGSRGSPRLATTRGWCRRATRAGALCGMAMTEKQGGSDVRANTTVARPLNGGGPGAEYEITGHKWFCSAPMCDAFLVLAQADGGLSCFLLPRCCRTATRNRFHIQRLKDKLGNRSNASSEIEFDGAWAQLVGEEGRGVPTIIEMVNHTRLDCVLGSTGGHAGRRRAGDPPRRAPRGVRQAPGRPAADAERARRPLHRVRGRDGHRDAARARLRRGAGGRARDAVQAPRHGGLQVLGLQARRRCTRSRRSSASAATATSRSRACRACTARRR